MNSRLLANRDKRKTVKLEVPLTCEICDEFENDVCENHAPVVEEVSIVIKALTWMRQQEIRTNSYIMNMATQNVQFSMSKYVTDCLSEMIIDAPWGETNSIMLLQIGPELGAALETVVPDLDGGSGSRFENIEKVKKVLS